jgi:hypothetical protein
MKESMGADYVDLADYFDACRVKRNVIDYDRAGGISEMEARSAGVFPIDEYSISSASSAYTISTMASMASIAERSSR